MKRIVVVVAVVAAVALLLLAGRASAQSVGYLADTENFPDMLKTKPTCSQAYGDFLTTAQPLLACRHLEEAKANLAAQQKVKEQMGVMKKCKDCKQMMVQADEEASAFSAQMKIYQAQCPDADARAKLLEKLPKQTKLVCGACDKKWPGTLGPGDADRCK